MCLAVQAYRLPLVILKAESPRNRVSNMRVLLLAICSAISCLSQESRSLDAKGLYQQAMNKLTGSGVSRNEIAAIDLMTRSADLGYVPAQLGIGYLYETGNHVAAEPMRAADWYRKAAAKGDHLAEYLLGRLYFTGVLLGGRKESERWLQAAGEASNPFAAYLLGTAIYEREPANGIRWYRTAAEQGLPYAQFRLGKALLEGRAGPVNRKEAYQWLFVALENGISGAATDLSAIEGVLGSNETEKAKTEARELQLRVRRSAVAKGCTGWPGELDQIPAPPPLELQRYCE